MITGNLGGGYAAAAAAATPGNDHVLSPVGKGWNTSTLDDTTAG
jgi:hypothetical protein